MVNSYAFSSPKLIQLSAALTPAAIVNLCKALVMVSKLDIISMNTESSEIYQMAQCTN